MTPKSAHSCQQLVRIYCDSMSEVLCFLSQRRPNDILVPAKCINDTDTDRPTYSWMHRDKNDTIQAGRRTGMRATWVSLNSHHLRQVTSSAT